MPRPRLLDLFCGAGGAAVGYHRAGFDVVGVDNRPMPRYPFEFVQADAMTFPLGEEFAVVHASPPCQDHSDLAHRVGTHGTGWMLEAIRSRLKRWGGMYVIENVDSAPMPDALILCGAAMRPPVDGYYLRRHRRFESSTYLMGPGCCCGTRTLGVYGTGGQERTPSRGRHATAAQARALMGIDWMTRAELSQAIPPAYTKYIGGQLIEALAWTP